MVVVEMAAGEVVEAPFQCREETRGNNPRTCKDVL